MVTLEEGYKKLLSGVLPRWAWLEKMNILELGVEQPILSYLYIRKSSDEQAEQDLRQ